ncbi:MAG: hypothetical protein HY286_12505 [Planctomycetes bacterium]|nr:hypothetical protein [Planctomycetota bacterium]
MIAKLRSLETAALAGMAAGVAVMVQPWWQAGMQIGFFMTAGFAILQNILAHLPGRRP